MRKSSTRTRLADIKFQEDSEEERKRLTIELKEIERERFVWESVQLLIPASDQFVLNFHLSIHTSFDVLVASQLAPAQMKRKVICYQLELGCRCLQKITCLTLSP